MKDEWTEDLLEARYGDVVLDVVKFRDSWARVHARYATPNRNGGYVDDQGADIRVTELELVFASGLRPNHMRRLQAFLNLLHDGQAHPFVHPVTGTYEARPGRIDFAGDATQRDELSMSLELVEHLPDPKPFEVAPAGSPAAGLAEVENAEEMLALALSGQGFSSDIVGIDASTGFSSEITASAAAQSWSESQTTARKIQLDVDALAHRIDGEVMRLELLTDIERLPLLQAFEHLRGSLRRAADLALTTRPALTTYRVPAPQPLLFVAQTLYGGRRALEGFERLLALNDIRDPAFLDEGVLLTVEAP